MLCQALRRIIMYKVIFVDFDNTYFIWDSLKERKDNILESRIKGTFDYKEYGFVNTKMVKKLKDYKSKNPNTMFHLISHCQNSVELKVKEQFILKETPDLFRTFISVSSAEEKILFIKTYAQACGIKSNDCILIDDMRKTIRLCNDSEIPAKTPIEVIYKGI